MNNVAKRERAIHRILETMGERLHARQEFFRVTVAQVRLAFDVLDGDYWNIDGCMLESDIPTTVSIPPIEPTAQQTITIKQQTAQLKQQIAEEKGIALIKKLETQKAGIRAKIAKEAAKNTKNAAKIAKDAKKNKSSERRFIDRWDGKEIGATAFYREYKQFCIDNELPYVANVVALGIKLVDFIRDGALLKRETSGGNLYYKHTRTPTV